MRFLSSPSPSHTDAASDSLFRAGGGFAALDKFPEYIAKTGYKNPNDGTNGPYQFAYSTSLNFFAYLQANNPLGIQFNHHMGGYRLGRPSWMDKDFYPVQDLLAKGADTSSDAVLLVDIGGSLGHDLEEFRRKHPDVPGRLVLQDLSVVIGQIEELHEKIEPMAHDFFTEQPIKGTFRHNTCHRHPSFSNYSTRRSRILHALGPARLA